MLDKNIKKKPKYETPILVPLGEMVEGSGACVAGETDYWDCTAGGLAQNACTAGPTNNGGTCSEGGSAAPTCTGGTAPG